MSKKQYCPLCNKVHEVEIKTEMTSTKINNKKVEFESKFYYCPTGINGEHKYINGKLLDQNLRNARKAYKEKYNEEI